MTTIVEFHVLASSDLRRLDQYACTQVAAWVAEGLTVCIHTDTLDTAERIDQALWTYSDQAFVPHEIATGSSAQTGQPPLPPVLVSVGAARPANCLLNLAAAVPDGFDGYARVIDLVDADNARRDAGRRRFVTYRDRGFPPETHKISQ